MTTTTDRENKRLTTMFSKMETGIRNNADARNALTSVNQMEQAIFVKAITSSIPSILSTIQPDINKFRQHQKEMAALRKQNEIPAPPKKRGRKPKAS